MSKRARKAARKPGNRPSCEPCEYCIYLGEGDFGCDEKDFEIVISNWIPCRCTCEKFKEER